LAGLGDRTSGDERAAASLGAADKLNMEVAGPAILEEQIRAKRPPVTDHTGGGVTIILEAADGSQTVVE
jgi:hypothetical protein